jgi:hypothetical protein
VDASTLLAVLALTLVLIGAGVLAMAIGVIFRRPCLRGSCGGTNCSCARRPRESGDPVSLKAAGFPHPRE